MSILVNHCNGCSHMPSCVKLILFRLFLISLPSLGNQTLKAQENEKFLQHIYGEFGLGYSTWKGKGLHTRLQLAIRNNFGLSLFYYHINMRHKNLPEDYQSAVYVINGEQQVIEPVKQGLQVYGASFGKFIELGKNIWWNADIGVSVLSGYREKWEARTVEDVTYPNGDRYTSSNYERNIQEGKYVVTPGLMVKTEVTWAILTFLGAGIEGFANLNTLQAPAGIHFKLLVGWLKRE